MSPLAWGPAAPFLARRAASDFAGRVGVGPAVHWRLLLVVSELVSNAVQHGGPPLALSLELKDDAILVEVGDGGTQEPRLRPRPVTAAGRGRGLEIVAALGREWGWHAREKGKIVWSEVPLTANPW